MARAVHDIQGYTIALDKVVFVTRVFEADDNEGWQFNIRFGGNVRLSPRFPTKSDADLARSLLVQALKES